MKSIKLIWSRGLSIYQAHGRGEGPQRQESPRGCHLGNGTNFRGSRLYSPSRLPPVHKTMPCSVAKGTQVSRVAGLLGVNRNGSGRIQQTGRKSHGPCCLGTWPVHVPFLAVITGIKNYLFTSKPSLSVQALSGSLSPSQLSVNEPQCT